MSSQSSETTVDQIIESASRYNKGRPVRTLLDSATAFDRLETPTKAEIDRFKELFYSLIEQTSDTDKRQIAIVLARNVYTPRAIIFYLAMQNVATASPVLLYSPLIGEVDIVTIAGKCDELALRVLARRNELTASTVRAIAARRDPTSINILRQNPSVKGSDSAKLLPDESAGQLDNSVPADNTIMHSNEPGVASKVRDKILTMAAPGKNRNVRKKTVPGIFTDSSGAPGILLKTARGRDKAAFFNQLSKQLGIGPARLKKLILDAPDNSLSAALRALEVPTNVASQIMLLMDPEIGTSIEKLRIFMKLYNALDSENCKRRFLAAGAKIAGYDVAAAASTPSRTVPHSKSVESQLAAALRDRRSAINEQATGQVFGRRTHAA